MSSDSSVRLATTGPGRCPAGSPGTSPAEDLATPSGPKRTAAKERGRPPPLSQMDVLRCSIMSARTPFTVEVASGRLGGWVVGDGVPVLLLHGGPGLSFDYLDELASELGDGFQVAGYQQRGLEPSTLEGPFTIAQAIDDALAVLEFLNWSRALIVGHSWGRSPRAAAGCRVPTAAAGCARGRSTWGCRRWRHGGV